MTVHKKSLSPAASRLKPANAEEAVRVRRIFSLYQELGTPPPKEHRLAVILKGFAKSDVPLGTEIWFDGEIT